MFLFRSESLHRIEPRSAPCGNKACGTSDRQQYCNDQQKYSRIERTYAIQHGANQMRLPNAGSQAEPESAKSGAEPVQEHEAEHSFSLCAKRHADANFRSALGNHVGKNAEQTDGG